MASTAVFSKEKKLKRISYKKLDA